MLVPCDDVMKEAFRRAQMRGRVFPQPCDFPPSVPTEALELNYLSPLRSLHLVANAGEKAATMGVRCSPVEETAFSQAADEAPCLTYGGDAWAAVLLLLDEREVDE